VNSCFPVGRIFSAIVAETYLNHEFEEKAIINGFTTKADVLN